MNPVGIVAVSHSRSLAEAAVALAMQMVHGETPRVVIAAGTADGRLGTDPTRIGEAITQADRGAGVVVVTDLGSAILSTEMALEFLDDAPEVRIVPAPFVEGIVAAVVQASIGAGLDMVASEASRALEPKQSSLGGSPQREPEVEMDGWVSADIRLPNTAGLHARPAARIVAEAARFDATVRVAGPAGKFADAVSPIALASLRAAQGQTLRIEASGEEAQEALAAMVALVGEGFGEMREADDDSPSPWNVEHWQPLGISPGRVVGPAFFLVPPMTGAPDVAALEDGELDLQPELLRQTIKAVARDYELRATRSSNPEAASILRATAVLTVDPILRDTALQIINDSGIGAANAFWQACNVAGDILASAGGRIAERTADIQDIRNRVVSQLLGKPLPGLPDPGIPHILLAEDLSPSDAASLDPQTCLALVTRGGGRTSHTSILARSLGIPAVVGFGDVDSIPAGSTVLVDGSTGEVIVSPSPEQYASAGRTVAQTEPLREPGRLADGTHVPLFANVGSLAGARTAKDARAEGIGLFRTEVCFLERTEEPSVSEQSSLYAGILSCFDDSPVVIRTLDAGSDKPMPFLTMPDEENPALGVRGYRTVQVKPDVMRRQLEAIADAIRSTNARPSIMAPMISTREEAENFATMARAAGLEHVGIMIETPSAALLATEILETVDFISIGTNDLAQYTMAADRLASQLSVLQDTWQPAVLRLIRMVGEAGQAAGKPIGVCGEAASDPELAPVLVGMGASTLSLSARALQVVAEALATVSMEDCHRAARAACGASSPEQARAAAADALAETPFPDVQRSRGMTVGLPL